MRTSRTSFKAQENLFCKTSRNTYLVRKFLFAFVFLAWLGPVFIYMLLGTIYVMLDEIQDSLSTFVRQ